MESYLGTYGLRADAATAERLRAHLMALTCERRAPGCAVPAERTVPAGLVDARRASPELLVLEAPAWSDAELRFLVRPEVASRLREAAGTLPSNLRLGFWEGLRPVYVQQTLWDASLRFLSSSYPNAGDHELEWLLESYVARPSGKQPPHSTGSAVDVAVVDGFGRVLSPADAWGRLAVESMARALSAAGMANYEPEWWHWSFGDEEWARVYDCAPLSFAATTESAGPGDGI